MNKKTQKGLPGKSQLERLASFTELNPRPVVELTLAGTVLYVNRSARKIFPELRTMGVKHPYLADFKSIAAFLKKKPSQAFSREVKLGPYWFRQFFYYLPEFHSILAYGTDVTERIQAEEALHQNTLQYRSLFNKMSESYILCEVVFDKQGKPVDYKFLDVNPAFERLIGFNRTTLIGKNLKDFFPQTALGEYAKALLTDKPVHIEYYSKPLQKWLSIFAFKTREHQFAALLIDITHQKGIEQEKDNFISILSHELRNPLTPILAAAQVIITEAIKPEVIEAAGIIERQSKIMAHLLDDVLDISRMSRKAIKLEKRAVNITTIVQQAIETTMPFVQQKNQSVLRQFPKKPIYMLADPVRLEQIIVNLVNNASKYTNPNGKITISAGLKKGMIEIVVKDNGVGIPAKKIKKIFDLFYVHRQPFNELGSMGIGLNISKYLVKMHDGHISVASKGENKGSAFTLTFPPLKHIPKQQAKKLDDRKTSMQKAIQKTSRKVLLVDDNKDITSLLAKIVEKMGHVPTTCYSGEEALSTLQRFKPDIALIDIGLPSMSGYEVAKKIKAFNAKITLVAMTGYGQEKDKVKSQAAGFQKHLIKPVGIEELKKILS